MSIDVTVGPEAVTIRFTGLDMLMACKRRRIVPLNHITDARVEHVDVTARDVGLEVSGCLPDISFTRFYTTRNRDNALQVWNVYRDKEVLVIDTDLATPSRLVVQTPDRRRVAKEINDRLQSLHNR
jgi:hypothetical protein